MAVTDLLAEFLSPLTEALEDMTVMQDLLSDLGIEVPLTAAHATALAGILPVAGSLAQLDQAAEGGAPLEPEAAAALAATVFQAVSALAAQDADDLRTLPGALSDPATWARVARDLPGHLLLVWLDDFHPVPAAILALGGAVDLVPRGAGQAPRRVLDWNRVGALATNPPAQIAAAWRFGGQDFDADGFLRALAALAHALGLRPRIPTPAPQLLAALADRAADGATTVLQVAPLAGSPAGARTTATIDLVGLSDPGAAGGLSGLALLPTITGTASAALTPAPGITLTVEAAGSASGGAGLAISPAGPARLGQVAGTASLSARLDGARPGGWVLAGAAPAAHLRIDRFAAAARLSVNPDDIGLTLDLADAITLHIAAGDDGLLAAVLGATPVEITGGLTADWTAATGLSLTGGLALDLRIPVGERIGPFEIDSLTLTASAGATGLSAGAAVTGSFEIGPLYLGFDDIGMTIDVTPLPDGQTGNFGPLAVVPAFRPPSGYGAALDFAPISGGGHVQKFDTEYRGALALQFESFGLSAFAILNTRLPGGQPGFSCAASVFASFNLPLAAGFFLTGVGGMLGINRTVDTDALREVLFDGRLDDLLFPADPIAAAPRILQDMATILPAQPGQHFFGPVARIAWGQPRLIHVTLGVIIEVGQDVRLVVLGGVRMVLPTEDQALVVMNLQFMGEIDFAEGRIDFDATLEGSRVLTFTISGDCAIRTGWGPGITQIASLGGLHPGYPRPSNLPDLRRLSAGFGKPGDSVRLTIAAYFAQTLTSVQFGARATLFAQGPKFPVLGRVSAEGSIGFDALIRFNPFSFVVAVDGGLSLMVDGKVKAALYFAITLSGPNPFHLSGEVWVKVCGVKVRFSVTHTFGNRQSAPDVTASAVDLLRAAVQAAAAFEAGGTGTGAVTFRTGAGTEGLLDPLGPLRLTQGAVPLDLRIDRLGEALVRGPRTLDLAVWDAAGAAVPSAPVTGEFVRGHFFALSAADRLRAPVFETHAAGLSFSATGFAATGAVMSADYAYEVIEIGAAPEPAAPNRSLFLPGADIGRLSGQFDTGRLRAPGQGIAALHVADAVHATAPGYMRASDILQAPAPGGRGLVPPPAAAALSAAPVRLIDTQMTLNAQVADYLSAA